MKDSTLELSAKTNSRLHPKTCKCTSCAPPSEAKIGRPRNGTGEGSTEAFNIRLRVGGDAFVKRVMARLYENKTDLFHRLLVEEAVKHGIEVPENLSEFLPK